MLGLPKDFHLNNLPALSIASRHLLPSTAGIYFVVSQYRRIPYTVYYIGQTKNLNSRWASHNRLEQFINLHRQEGIQILYYICKNDITTLLHLESYFTGIYHPILERSKGSRPKELVSKTKPLQITLPYKEANLLERFCEQQQLSPTQVICNYISSLSLKR